MILVKVVTSLNMCQIDIFLFPLVATWLESRIYGVRPPEFVGFWSRLFRRRGRSEIPGGPDDVLSADTAVKLDHLSKTYNTKTLGLFGGKSVTAIEDLSFQVPKGEIFCLLGRNGAAKSTTLHIIARLISASGGRIRYSPDLHLGIASQKDVLWDELNCKQASVVPSFRTRRGPTLSDHVAYRAVAGCQDHERPRTARVGH